MLTLLSPVFCSKPINYIALRDIIRDHENLYIE